MKTTVLKSLFLKIVSIRNLLITLSFLSISEANAQATQEYGQRAERFMGTVWGGIPAHLLDDRLLSLKAVDGWVVRFNEGAIVSGQHAVPVPALADLEGADAAFPDADGLNTMQNNIDIITDNGYMVKAYSNAATFLENNTVALGVFEESFKEWCDTNPEAQAFINSQSYHTMDGFPERPYMFCYAEFVLKYYSQQFGAKISQWIFDSSDDIVSNGDNATNGNIDDQRLFIAFADAVRAGNPHIAVAFNNGRSTINNANYPFQNAKHGEDFTFGHAFGGNNNHASGTQLTLNRRHVDRMQDTGGFVYLDSGRDWDNNIVGHFYSKLGTGSWRNSPIPAWSGNQDPDADQDLFNEWNVDALGAGGMMLWEGCFNRPETTVYGWVTNQWEALDAHLVANNISFNPDPEKIYHIDNPVHGTRLAANGSDEDAYTTNTNVDNDDTRWRFIRSSTPGLYHIQRAAGGSSPRLRTDLTVNPDMEATSSSGDWTKFSVSASPNRPGQYLLTVPQAPTDLIRFRMLSDGSLDFATINNRGINPSLVITEVTLEPEEQVVHITKSNAPNFALDGNYGGENAQDVYLWAANENNENQQWIEIDRGDGYYSYQKMGTNFCIDGGALGASNGQNVYLWNCIETNQNQQWQKVEQTDGSYRLVKRNDSGFAINSGDDGQNRQEVNLWTATHPSTNLNWIIEPINVSAKSIELNGENKAAIFPNPITSTTTIQGAANSIITIFNINGQELLTKEILTDNEALDLSALVTGIYYAQVRGELETCVIKILKE